MMRAWLPLSLTLIALGCEPSGPRDWEKAVRAGDFESFKKIAESNPNLETALPGRQPPMDVAVESHNLKVVRYLESRGVGLTIDQASSLGDRERVKAMLKAKPWLAKLPNTPLFGAVRAGDLEMTRLLLAHGAATNAAKWGYQTPLGSAVGWGVDGSKRIQEEIALELLAHGAEPHAEGGKNCPDVAPFIFRHGSERLLRAYLAAGADPYSETWSARPALVAAAGEGDVDRIKLLLRLGLDPHRISGLGVSPLAAAAFHRKREAADLLLAQGVPLDFYVALALGRRDAVLLAAAADPNLIVALEPASGNPPLYFAALSADARLVADLIARGADPKARCRSNWEVSWFDRMGDRDAEKTPLLQAVASFAAPDVYEVIRRAANPTLPESRSLLLAALGARQWEVARRILQQTPLKEFSDAERRRAVNAAIASDLEPALRILLDAGLDPNSVCSGIPLLNVVLRAGDETAAKLLLERRAVVGFEAAVRLGRMDLVKQFLAKDPAAAVRPIKDAGAWLGADAIPAEIAINAKRPEVLRALLAATPDLKAVRDAAPMLVRWAVRAGEPRSLQVMADARIDVMHARSYLDAVTPTIVFAAGYDAQPAVVQWLIEHRADVNARSPDRGETALHQSVRQTADDALRNRDDEGRSQRALEVTKHLLQAGADANARDARERTPLHVAAETCHFAAIELLLKHGARADLIDSAGATPADAARDVRLPRGDVERRQEIIALLERHAAANRKQK